MTHCVTQSCFCTLSPAPSSPDNANLVVRCTSELFTRGDCLSQQALPVDLVMIVMAVSCSLDIPDLAFLATLQILLGYLPDRQSEWPTMLKKQRTYYNEFIKEFIMDTHSEAAVEQDPLGALVSDPLGALCLDDVAEEGGAAATNQWDIYFKDNATIEQIDKDVKRL
jgi:hypothetical protein